MDTVYLKKPERDVKAKLKEVGLTFTKNEYDEYRVNYKGGREATAFYTEDLDDALNTGLYMAKEKIAHANRNKK